MSISTQHGMRFFIKQLPVSVQTKFQEKQQKSETKAKM
jgi:hypothetical protein